MPFYEMLPGGMPAGLQSDMDAVLNKKWGTSTTYPPEDWPETVNLMGPLPERTVSGAVVTFPDGAYDVPLKSASFGIAASGGGGTPSAPVLIDGVSSVDVVQMGKNLCDPSDVGNYAISGTDGSVATNANSLATYNKIPVGTNSEISVSCGDYCDVRGIYCYGANDSFLGRPGVLGETNQMTRTLASGTTHIRVTFRKHGGGAVSPSDLTSAQIEFGSSSTTYSPYVSTTHTANLGQTVYGGTLSSDGTLTITHKVYETSQDDYNWLTGYYAFGYRYYQTAPQGAKVGGCKSDISVAGAGDLRFTVDSDNRLNAYCTSESGYDTLEKFKQALGAGIKILYELDTPIIITGLDEISISTYLGDNILWTDGNLSVTYRRDIDLALAQ